MPALSVQPVHYEPPVLDGDMRPADLVDTLERLRFKQKRSSCLVRIDRETRDYLVRKLKERH